jgi:phosphatidate cytidylyltransferase
MLAVAGAAWWFGGWLWIAFVGVIGLGVLWEWASLVFKLAAGPVSRGFWLAAGVGYVGVAALVLLILRSEFFGREPVLILVAAVIATDIGAYAFGRTIGGPKIAPSISPSKTWAGLAGGMIGASAVLVAVVVSTEIGIESAAAAVAEGCLIAIVAQAGDFFESWMKRRAGVKDSGRLIPGHGGLFDRVDGLLGICFVLGLYILFTRAFG